MSIGLGESLGLKNEGLLKMIQRIEKGLPYSSLVKFQKTSGLPLAAIEEVIGLPRSTRARRKKEGSLNHYESDRLLRLSRLFEQGQELFDGDAVAIRQWLLAPCRALGGYTPIEFCKTDAGSREVERVIGRLSHGVFT